MKTRIEQTSEEKRRLTALRDRELLRDYRREVREAFKSDRPINRRSIIRKVLANGTPSYYVDFDHAYNVISRINCSDEVPKKNTMRREMWLEIFHKVKAEQERHPQLSLKSALTRIIATGRASRYFISESYAYKYIYQACRSGRG